MVIDDEEFCLFSMKSLLLMCGVDIGSQVDFCFGGQQAIDRVKTTYSNKGSYRLILTDFSMPIVDGIEATRQIRSYLTHDARVARSEQPRIIGVTGHLGNEFEQLGLESGMDDVKTKPMKQKILLELLQR